MSAFDMPEAEWKARFRAHASDLLLAAGLSTFKLDERTDDAWRECRDLTRLRIDPEQAAVEETRDEIRNATRDDSALDLPYA